MSRSGLRRFVSELRRRRVVRSAGVYAASAFVVLQAADLAVEPLRLPGSTMTFLWVLALAAFPVALALAWAFDVVPDAGGPGAGDTPSDAPAVGRPPGTVSGRLRIAFLILLLAAPLGAWGVLSLRRAPNAALDANVVAVLPFRVSGADPSLGYLREGMVDLLAAKLTGEGGPRAVDPRALLAAWQRQGEAREPDEAGMLALARQLGAGRLLSGAVVGTPSRLTLSARLVDPRAGRAGAPVSVDGPADSLPALVDRLAAALLSLDAGESERRLASLTSTSLPALRAYLEGQRAQRAGRFEEAVLAFTEALRHDSTFALAALGVAKVDGWVTDVAFDHGRAYALRDRLSGRDRAELQAYVRRSVADSTRFLTVAEQLATQERLLSVAPESPEAAYRYGDRLLAIGPQLARPGAAEKAFALLSRAVERDSSFAPPLMPLFRHALARGDTAELRRLARAYFAVDSAGEMGLGVRWVAARALGDAEEIARLEPRFEQFPRVALRFILENAALPNGPLEDGDRAAEILLRRATTINERANALQRAIRYALLRGRPAEAARLSWELRANAPRAGLPIFEVGIVSQASYMDGDRAAADSAARVIERSLPADHLASPDERLLLDGIRCALEAWRLWNGSTGSAPASIRLLVSRPSPPVSALDRLAGFSTASCALELAAIHAVQTRAPDARAAVERLERHLASGESTREAYFEPLVVARLWDALGEPARALAAIRRRYLYPLSFEPHFLREEGRLAALVGERDAAIQAYQHYLRLRSDPEPALRPEVERIRGELARLVGEAGR